MYIDVEAWAAREKTSLRNAQHLAKTGRVKAKTVRRKIRVTMDRWVDKWAIDEKATIRDSRKSRNLR